LLKVMGRDAGHIALNAGSGAGAGDSYPWRRFRFRSMLESLKKVKHQVNHQV
jgi:6-phosphofructokinase